MVIGTLRELCEGLYVLNDILQRLLGKNPMPPVAASPSTEARMFAIHAVHAVCPNNRWQLFEDIFSSGEAEDQKRNILMEMSSLGGPEAKAFLKKMVDKKLVPESLSMELAMTEKQLASPHARDLCKK